MWEMFSLGDTPYTAGSQWGPEFVSFLDQGLRLEAPEYARQEMYENIVMKHIFFKILLVYENISHVVQ